MKTAKPMKSGAKGEPAVPAASEAAGQGQLVAASSGARPREDDAADAAQAPQYPLVLSSVTKQRRQRQIGPIDLHVPRGYCVAIVGTNGAGKSTLLNMMIGAVLPDSGTLALEGTVYPGELPRTLRGQIGYVPATPMFAEQGLDAAGAARFRAQWYDAWDEGYYEELMALFQVPQYTVFKQLSHGEQRKFQLVAALATRPRLLILDEPSSGYDPFAWAQMIDVLQAYLASGDGDVTIVIASHNMEEVRRLADYVVLLDQGKMLGMAEKDVLQETWRECWFQLRGTLPADLPGVVHAEEMRPGYYSVISSEWQAVAHDLRSYGVEDIQFRQLEAEEALKLWLEGHQPPLASV